MTIGVSVTALTLSSSASFDFWPALIGPDCAVRPCIEAALKNALGRHCKLCMQSSRSETTAKVYGRSMTIKCYCRVVELSGGKEIERPIQHMLLVFNNPPRWAKQSPVNCVKSCWKTNQKQVKIRLLPDNVNKTWASRFACVGGEGRSEFDKEGRTLNKKTLACDLEDRSLFFSYTQILKVKVYKRALRHSTEGVEVIWLSFHCVCVCGERVHERKSFTERRKDSPSCSLNSLKRSIWISTSVKNLVCIN